jgi:hypothetical protein
MTEGESNFPAWHKTTSVILVQTILGPRYITVKYIIKKGVFIVVTDCQT